MRVWLVVLAVTFSLEPWPRDEISLGGGTGGMAGESVRMLADAVSADQFESTSPRRRAPRRLVKPRLRRSLRQLYHRFPEPPSSNYTLPSPDPYDLLLPENAVILNIGSKDGRVRARGSGRVLNVDIDPSVNPDIVADAHDLHMIPTNTADCVLAISMLHHCRKPWRVVEELHRVLKAWRHRIRQRSIHVSVPRRSRRLLAGELSRHRRAVREFREDRQWLQSRTGLVHGRDGHPLRSSGLLLRKQDAVWDQRGSAEVGRLVDQVSGRLSLEASGCLRHTGTYFLGRKPDERPVGAAESDRVPPQAPLCAGQAGREDPRR
jgi:SAM-dependent methyltransferase